MSFSELEQLTIWQKRFFQCGIIVLLGLILWGFSKLCNYFSDVTNIVGFSILISYLLIGAVDLIQAKLKIRNRGLAVAIVYSLIGILAILFAIFVIPNLILQIQSLTSQTPSYFQKIQSWLVNYNGRINASGFPYTFDLALISKELSHSVSSFGQKALHQFFEFAFSTINFAISGLATIVLSVYFLIDGPRIWDGLIRPLSEEYTQHANNLRHDLSRCLRGYFIGQVQLSLFSGVYVFFMYSLLGSRYALLLGIWQALVEIIPVIGGFLGIGLGVLVMLFNPDPIFGNPLIKALIAFVAYMFYTQIIKDNFLTPRIMGNAIGLHPVVIILVVFIGAKAGGITGVVFALPMAGLLNVVLDYYLKNRNKPEPDSLVVEVMKT
jgi:predicted PurR-regulated permease PerM